MKNYALLISAICAVGLAGCGAMSSCCSNQSKKSVTTTVVTAPAETCTHCNATPMVVAVPAAAPAPAPVAVAAPAPAPAPAPVAAPAAPVTPLCAAPSSVRVSAVGYGSTSALTGLTPGQKKLLGMRASKMDAYRSMAEQVAGVRVTGNTTVADMMSKNDGLRVAVDAYVRGARVVTVTPMSDGNYETILEVELDNQFYSAACQPQAMSSQGPAVIRAADAQGTFGTRSSSSGGFYYGD